MRADSEQRLLFFFLKRHLKNFETLTIWPAWGKGDRGKKHKVTGDSYLPLPVCVLSLLTLFSFSCRFLSSGFEVQPAQEVARGEVGGCVSVQDLTHATIRPQHVLRFLCLLLLFHQQKLKKVFKWKFTHEAALCWLP